MQLPSFHKLMKITSIATLSLALLTACSEEEVKQTTEVVRPVKLFTINDEQYQDLRKLPAIVSANEEASLSFRIAGTLMQLPIHSGALVKKGQVLGRLDDQDARYELQARQADFDLANAEFARIQSLHEKKVVSRSQFDTASARLKATQATLKLAKDKLKYTVLTAPFNGRIAEKMVENHQSVKAQQVVMILQDVQTLEVSIQLPETMMKQVRSDRIEDNYHPYITFANDTDKHYPVTYKEHATKVTPGTQSYQVTFTLNKPDNVRVYPGMGATLTLDMDKLRRPDTLNRGVIVPITAVLQNNATGKHQVWVYNSKDHTVSPRDVTVGEINQSGIKVLSGVHSGEQIVSAGLLHLREGMHVKPLQRERGV